MAKRRRSYETGHRRKFLVVVDDTPEVDQAICYAALRAERTGGVITMLYVIDDTDFRSFIGIEKVMRQDAREQAELTLAKAAERAKTFARVDPETMIREGGRASGILSYIEEDEDVAVLVLAAGTSTDGPGPLVSSLAGRGAASFPIPVTIVPGSLTPDEIKALA
jgi:nucleotide-binding universal stress UspA family protein